MPRRPYIKFLSVFALALFGLTAVFTGFSTAEEKAAESTPPPRETSADIQKTIDLLENEESRNEVLRLLRLMAALEAEAPGRGEAAAEDEPPAEPTEIFSRAGLRHYFFGLAAELWRQVESVKPGLAQSWRSMDEVFKALGTESAGEIWLPYVFKICCWGLFCLLATWAILRKYGRPPELCYSDSIRKRAWGVAKYALTLGGPSLFLIVTLLFIPPISSTEPGVTADMGIGFSFIQALIQHFFINLSLLYLSLRVAAAILTPGCQGRPLINMHPVLARHFLHSFRCFSIYVALFIFMDETFLNHFAAGVIYKLCLIVMTFPIPVYLTFRLIKLRRLTRLVSEAEEGSRFLDDEADAAANSDDGDQDLETPAEPRLDYWFDLLLKKYWAPLALALVWILSLVSLTNPLNVAVMFGGRLSLSIAVCAVAALFIRVSRILMLRLIDEKAEHGRHLVLNTDNFFNIVIWSLTLMVLISIWGLPISALFKNDLAREILSRAFTIALVLAVLAVFIRFSHLAADWLLAVPAMSANRNLRTITPLVLGALRFLAVFVAIVVVLERLGVNIGPILAGAGILGLGVGMGAQSLVKDIINGVSILMMDTLSVGDWVTVGGQSGTVESVGLRSIRLRDSTGNLNVVPNSSITTIVNMTRDYSQDLIEFTAPYDADPDAMLALARDVASELSLDPDWRRCLTAPVSVVGVVGFDSGGTTIRLKIATTAGDQWAVGRELKLRLKRRLMQAGYKSTWFGQNVIVFNGQTDEAGPRDGRLTPNEQNRAGASPEKRED